MKVSKAIGVVVAGGIAIATLAGCSMSPQAKGPQLGDSCRPDGATSPAYDPSIGPLICRGGEWWSKNTDPGPNPWKTPAPGTGTKTGGHFRLHHLYHHHIRILGIRV